MGGRSRCSSPPALPLLVVVLLLAIAAAQLLDDVRRYRMAKPHRQMLSTGELTLPVGAYSFDDLDAGEQLDPDARPYSIVNGTSACHCRHLCLASPVCLLYKHEAEGGTCSLYFNLLPGNVTQDMTGGRSVGRRRGISWLGAPCHVDRDCSLLVSDAECGHDQTCSCHWPGWVAVNKTHCLPDGRWLPLATGSLASAPLTNQAQNVPQVLCKISCRRSYNCWAYSYTKSTSHCRRYAAAVVTGDAEPDGDTVSLVWQFGRPDGVPPEGYRTVSDRRFLLTDPVPGPEAADACLRLGGVLYAPDSRELMAEVKTALGVYSYAVGLNDQLEEGRFDAADGVTRHLPWVASQPNRGRADNCAIYNGNATGLHDFPCSYDLRHLCEYIGPDLLTSKPSPPRDDAERQLTWWTYDLRATLQVSRVLYLARNATGRPQLTEIRLGHHPEDVTELQSMLCASRTGPLAAAGFSLRLACARPLAGRYLHVGQRPAGSAPLWEKMAVFGN